MILILLRSQNRIVSTSSGMVCLFIVLDFPAHSMWYKILTFNHFSILLTEFFLLLKYLLLLLLIMEKHWTWWNCRPLTQFDLWVLHLNLQGHAVMSQRILCEGVSVDGGSVELGAPGWDEMSQSTTSFPKSDCSNFTRTASLTGTSHLLWLIHKLSSAVPGCPHLTP